MSNLVNPTGWTCTNQPQQLSAREASGHRSCGTSSAAPAPHQSDETWILEVSSAPPPHLFSPWPLSLELSLLPSPDSNSGTLSSLFFDPRMNASFSLSTLSDAVGVIYGYQRRGGGPTDLKRVRSKFRRGKELDLLNWTPANGE